MVAYRSDRSDRLELLDCSIITRDYSRWYFKFLISSVCLSRIEFYCVQYSMSHHHCKSPCSLLSWNSNQSRRKNLVETSSGLRLRKVLTRFLKSLKCFWFGCSRKISKLRRNTGSFISLRMAGDSEGSLRKKIYQHHEG